MRYLLSKKINRISLAFGFKENQGQDPDLGFSEKLVSR